MKKDLIVLIKLSYTDSTLAELQTEKNQLPHGIEEARIALNQAQAELDAIQENIQGMELKNRAFENEVGMEDTRLRRSQSRMLEVKKSDEYQAMTREIAQSKKLIKELEDNVLKLMLEVDEQQKLVPDAEKKRDELNEALSKVSQEVESRMAEIDAQVTDLTKLREAVLGQVDQKILAQYEKVLSRQDLAVALAVKSICQECNNKLPPQLFNELQRMEKIIQCPNCYRLLFLQEQLDEALG